MYWVDTPKPVDTATRGSPRWRALGGRDLVDHLLLAAALAADEDDVELLEQFVDEAQLVARGATTRSSKQTLK